MRARCVLVPVALLAACSRGPSGDARREDHRQSAAQADARPVIAAFGDSLTEGFGADPASTYPEALQRLLDGAGYRYRVVNLGVSGETSSDGLARVGTVLAEKPTIVILEFGANDGLRGVPVRILRANLERMIAALQDGGAAVVLAGMTLPPNYGREYIREFEAVFREVADRRRVAFIPFLLEGVAPDPRYMLRDGLHPNGAGYAIIARTVFQAIRPLLKPGKTY
ncbi:MAG: arylesterase [Bryobacteraceae bacterium]